MIILTTFIFTILVHYLLEDKSIFRKKRRVFDRKELRKAIEHIKEIRHWATKHATDPSISKKDKEVYEKHIEMYDIAKDAMEAILYDL